MASKEAILLDVVQQGLECVDQDQWPGLYANLEFAKGLLTGKRKTEEWIPPACSKYAADLERQVGYTR